MDETRQQHRDKILTWVFGVGAGISFLTLFIATGIAVYEIHEPLMGTAYGVGWYLLNHYWVVKLMCGSVIIAVLCLFGLGCTRDWG